MMLEVCQKTEMKACCSLKFGRIPYQKDKERSSRGKRKREVFYCRRVVCFDVKCNVIPTVFVKTKGGRVLFGAAE